MNFSNQRNIPKVCMKSYDRKHTHEKKKSSLASLPRLPPPPPPRRGMRDTPLPLLPLKFQLAPATTTTVLILQNMYTERQKTQSLETTLTKIHCILLLSDKSNVLFFDVLNILSNYGCAKMISFYEVYFTEFRSNKR